MATINKSVTLRNTRSKASLLKLILRLLTLILCVSICGCSKDSSDEPILDVQTNSTEVHFAIIRESVTPVSISVKSECYLAMDIYVSSDAKVIDNIIAQIVKMGYCDYTSANYSFSNLDSWRENVIRGLSPSTKYFIIGVMREWSNNQIKISPIQTFQTDNFPLYVNLGGDIKWCGVNYKSNREDSDAPQFNSQDLFFSYTLPDPSEETIRGDWRYPTKNELRYLCDNCDVTLIDFKNKFVRITANNGTHLYIPFTCHCPLDVNCNGYKDFYLFPCDEKTTGIYVHSGESLPYYSEFENKVFYGEKLNGYSLKILSPNYSVGDFFNWRYIDGTVNPEVERTGSNKRGCRFVCP